MERFISDTFEISEGTGAGLSRKSSDLRDKGKETGLVINHD